MLIARALARKPRILLLDEATSALDNHTQSVVQDALGKLSITCIAITHRVSTVRDVDRIHVLDRGRIAESGRYDDLIARDGVFAELAKRLTRRAPARRQAPPLRRMHTRATRLPGCARWPSQPLGGFRCRRLDQLLRDRMTSSRDLLVAELRAAKRSSRPPPRRRTP